VRNLASYETKTLSSIGNLNACVSPFKIPVGDTRYKYLEQSQRAHVVNHHPLCYGCFIVVRASRRAGFRKARNIDVALSGNPVGSQT